MINSKPLIEQADCVSFKQVFDLSPDPCWLIEENRFVACNNAAVRMLGYSSQQELLNIHPSQLSPSKQPDGEMSYTKAERMMNAALATGLCRFDWVHVRSNGACFDAEVTLCKIDLGERALIYCVWRDISERKKTERLLQESEQHYRTLANGGTTLIWTSGLDKLCNYFNEPWLRFTGRTLDQEIGNGWADGVHPDDYALCLQTYLSSFDQQIPFSMEYRIRNADGNYRWIRDDGNPRYDSKGRFIGYIGYCMDITDNRNAEELIRNLAYYDTLTGLPNRRLLEDRLEKSLASSDRHGRQGALFFIDLDNFKQINDNLGHEAGDLLLRETATRLLSCIRQGDTAARYGGDEFIVLLDYLDQDKPVAQDQVNVVGAKIHRILSQPYDLAGTPCQSTSSIGVTFFQDKSRSAAEVIKEADLLMYKVKQTGRNAFCVELSAGSSCVTTFNLS